VEHAGWVEILPRSGFQEDPRRDHGSASELCTREADPVRGSKLSISGLNDGTAQMS
jgi:hypothetical protein